MQSWMHAWERKRSRPWQASPTRKPTLEALEERVQPSLTPYSYTAQFVANASPPQSTPVLTFLNTTENIGNPSNYSAQIAWGDASSADTTYGTIVLLNSNAEGSTYEVIGAHTYANTGSYAITVTIFNKATNQTVDGVGLAEVVTPNQHFVQAMYETLLGRAADPSGYTHFLTELQNGASRYQVVQEVQGSAEYQTLEVDQLYQQILGRAPDSTGLSTWTNFLANGGTENQLEAILLGSQEFFNDHGQSDASYIQAVYQLVLNRTVDPSGAQVYSQDLSSEMTLTSVAAMIVGSTEGAQNQVQALYEQALSRSADSGGLQTWSNAMLQGMTREQLLANLVASDEYFAQQGPISSSNQTILQT